MSQVNKFRRNYTSQPEHVEVEKNQNKHNKHVEWSVFF